MVLFNFYAMISHQTNLFIVSKTLFRISKLSGNSVQFYIYRPYVICHVIDCSPVKDEIPVKEFESLIHVPEVKNLHLHKKHSAQNSK